MATDTDATAARLRDELWHIAMNLNPTATVSPAWNHRLDTLIQYHRSQGAVEAWEAADNLMHLPVYRGPSATSGAHELLHDHLAAARARLVAYEEDR